jgi:hypothetical protein
MWTHEQIIAGMKAVIEVCTESGEIIELEEGRFVQTHGWRVFGGRYFFLKNVDTNEYAWSSRHIHDDSNGNLRGPFESFDAAVENLYYTGLGDQTYWPFILRWE